MTALAAWAFIFTAGPPEIIGMSVPNLTEASCKALSGHLHDDMRRRHGGKTFGHCIKTNQR